MYYNKDSVTPCSKVMVIRTLGRPTVRRIQSSCWRTTYRKVTLNTVNTCNNSAFFVLQVTWFFGVFAPFSALQRTVLVRRFLLLLHRSSSCSSPLFFYASNCSDWETARGNYRGGSCSLSLMLYFIESSPVTQQPVEAGEPSCGRCYCAHTVLLKPRRW